MLRADDFFFTFFSTTKKEEKGEMNIMTGKLTVEACGVARSATTSSLPVCIKSDSRDFRNRSSSSNSFGAAETRATREAARDTKTSANAPDKPNRVMVTSVVY